MSENLGKIEQETWIAFVRSSQQVLDRVEQSLKANGFPPLAWYDALLELDRAPEGRLRLSELGERMLLKKFNVTRLVDRLEKEGLVKRIPCDDDARGAYAAITLAGKKLRRAMWPLYRDAVKKYFLRRLNKDDLTVFSQLLESLQN